MQQSRSTACWHRSQGCGSGSQTQRSVRFRHPRCPGQYYTSPSDTTVQEMVIGTYPSRTALPKGRTELVPPRNVFQMVSPNAEAWSSEVKDAAPVAPPRDMVTILPLDWQNWMSDARKLQSGMSVPGKSGSSEVLQICARRRQLRQHYNNVK